jgi:TPR repeat protein
VLPGDCSFQLLRFIVVRRDSALTTGIFMLAAAAAAPDLRLGSGFPAPLAAGLRAIACIMLLWLQTTAASAETRVALVIGNSDYAFARLANPKSDADLMARTLKGVGFDVIKRTDANMQTMRQAFTEFARRLRQPDAVGVFYYAGHGVQVNGQNYLIPIGADITAEGEVALQAINLSELLASMRGASSRINIAILDACRNNPYESQVRSITRGLAPVSAPAGTLISYATAPGEVALDGTDGHSPFTAALARAIPTPGLAIEEVFKHTREAVLAATQNRQTPWEHSSLVGNFIFKAKTVEQEPSRRPLAAASGAADDRRLTEIAAWDEVKATNNAKLLRRHIETYPGGAYEELAYYKIAQLERQPTGWSWWQTGGNDAAATRSEADGAFERAVKLDAAGETPEALAEAARLYQIAAEQGVATAMHNLARMFDKGRGVTRDAAQAAAWYEKAANAGHIAAQGSLGTLYEFGEGVPVNLAEALRLYRQAADKGDGHAMTSLGYLYAQGKGVGRDSQEARKWYVLASGKGVVRAMFNLALMQMRGEGGPVDGAGAIRWLNTAVDKGHSGAMRELAYLHDEGRIVDRDAARAAEYLVAALQALKVESRAGARTQAAAAVDAMLTKDNWSFATRRATQKRLISEGLCKLRVTGLFDRTTKQCLRALAIEA